MFLKESHLGGFRVWTVDRPERLNGLGPTLAAEFVEKLDALAENLEDCKGLVLRAATVERGNRGIWIAGGDLKELAHLDRVQAATYSGIFHSLRTRIASMNIPVITAIDGEAIGGGAEFALMGDIRLATRRSRLIFKQLEVGLPTGFGGGQRLVQLVGLGLAQRWLYFAEAVAADELERCGVFHHLYANGAEMEADLKIIVERLQGYRAFGAQKALLNLPPNHDPDAVNLFSETWLNPQHKKNLEPWQI